MRAYIGLGSNLGDRLAYLQLGLDALTQVRDIDVLAVSHVYETAPVGGPPQDAFLNAVVAIETDLDPNELLQECQHVEELAARERKERWGPRTLDVDILLVEGVVVDTDHLTIPHPRMWERGFVLAPLRDVAPELVDADTTWEGVREAGVALIVPPARSASGQLTKSTERVRGRQRGRGNPNSRTRRPRARGHDDRVGAPRARVGSRLGRRRAPDTASTMAAVACLGSRAALVSDAGKGAAVVVIATPDRSIEAAALNVASSLEPGALVVHLAGSRGIDAFADLQAVRPDVRVGALHPLQSFPTAAIGLERLHGSWAAVAGDPQVDELARTLGLRPFDLPDSQRMQYHAAAVVASNHIVALLGQVERLASACDVPFEAFAPLVESSVINAFGIGPALALTGPVVSR